VLLRKLVGGGIALLIADWGSCRIRDGNAAVTLEDEKEGYGTPLFKAPEMALPVPMIGAASDVWGVGVIAMDALTGEVGLSHPLQETEMLVGTALRQCPMHQKRTAHLPQVGLLRRLAHLLLPVKWRWCAPCVTGCLGSS
jgi:hypothetical protein